MGEHVGELTELIVEAVRRAERARTSEAVAEALLAVDPAALEDYFHRGLASGVEASPIASGLPASPGAAAGTIVLSAADALAAADRGEDVVLVRPETTPDDVAGMQVAAGVLTSRGGLVSHAAVVARGWGIPAVVGAVDVQVGTDAVDVGGTVLRAGDELTIDGSSGLIYAGALPTIGTEPPAELATLLGWADRVAAGRVDVRVNADTEGDGGRGRSLGARGIGLCRTEHMFLSAERLPLMRRFILSDDPAAEAASLAELEEAQEADFERLLAAMGGLPVTVRLLDPPLHEFLPDLLDLTARDARGELDDDGRAELVAARRLHETNPMIGTRGVRLGVVRRGVYEMQVRALCRAAAVLFERGEQPRVEIMIPLVVDAEELRIARGWVTSVLDDIGHPELAAGVVTVGAMIETPRAALTAGTLAEHADFFSFGTNDLTQLTYAFSRDDVEAKLLPAYQALGVLPTNPFAVLDRDGVGELLRLAAGAARAAKPAIKLGACGEHAGHPDSVAFLVGLGVDSVSCSPMRVPIARLGVAQALLSSGRVDEADLAVTFAEDRPASDASNGSPVADPRSDTVDEPDVLHVLAVRGFVTPSGFEASLGAVPQSLLETLVAEGAVRHVEARDMYGLLPPGVERHQAALAAWAVELDLAALADPYERFLAANARLKTLCTDWQVRDGTPNDHGDPAYDAECVGGLSELVTDVEPLIDEFATIVPRLARYRERLDAAASAVAAGDGSRFTGVMCESFHDVWMELHEDLIKLMGIDRAAEGSF